MSQRVWISRAISSETSLDQPSAVLNPTTRTVLQYWPSIRSRTTISRSVSPTLVSRHADPEPPAEVVEHKINLLVIASRRHDRRGPFGPTHYATPRQQRDSSQN